MIVSGVLQPEAISTKRLVLEPLDKAVAQAVMAEDVSAPEHADGWPHDDTRDAIRMSTAMGASSLVWLVTLGGLVVGDCGTVGDLDDAGDVEIGYGLAAEYRRLGYGNEVVQALSCWLLGPTRSRAGGRAGGSRRQRSITAGTRERRLRPRARTWGHDVVRAAVGVGELRLPRRSGSVGRRLDWSSCAPTRARRVSAGDGRPDATDP